ncbi:MAG: ribulose-phosphate 3-epimerase [Bacilli bacterium]|nr:ribulose-phosphate 3-epimerase [Bacilli bacterium]
MIVSPSILAADFNNLDKEMEKVNKSSCEWVHLDVMDGKFVPNTTFDDKLIKELRPISNKVFDVHLMIEEPEKYLDKYYEAGADYVTFHYEACSDISKVLKKVKAENKKIGISIKPGTDVQVLDEYLADLDLILVMSVEPGKGGQKFMPSSIDKIDYLIKQKEKNGYHYLVEVDGGINNETAKLVKEVGCEAVVAGTYLFKNEDFVKATKELGEL